MQIVFQNGYSYDESYSDDYLALVSVFPNREGEQINFLLAEPEDDYGEPEQWCGMWLSEDQAERLRDVIDQALKTVRKERE